MYISYIIYNYYIPYLIIYNKEERETHHPPLYFTVTLVTLSRSHQKHITTPTSTPHEAKPLASCLLRPRLTSHCTLFPTIYHPQNAFLYLCIRSW